MTPYLQSAQQAQALKQGGISNISNAFNDVGNLSMGVALLNPSGGGNQDDDMKQIQALLLSLQNKGNGINGESASGACGLSLILQ